MFPREGGDPDWAPAFAGEQEGTSSSGMVRLLNTAIPVIRATPAKAGAQLGDAANEGCALLLRPFQLGPGLRRDGWSVGRPPQSRICIHIGWPTRLCDPRNFSSACAIERSGLS